MVQYEPRVVPRELWLYDDRCMMNWLGWLLSDHSAAMEQAVHSEHIVEQDEMSLQALDACLTQAFETHAPVAIQMEAAYSAAVQPEQSGFVIAHDGGRVYLQGADGQLQILDIEGMRHARIVDPSHWWAA